MTRSEQRDVVLAGGAQDLSDLRHERFHVVADAALAELAKAREVPPYLRRVHVRVVRELLRGDRLLAHLLGLCEHLQVARKAGRHAQRKALGGQRTAVPFGGHGAERRIDVAHCRDSRRARRAVSSTTYSHSSSPSIATTGTRSK